MTFAILDSGITTSSLWSQPYHVRILFISMLAEKDKNGFVKGRPSGLLRLANLRSLEETNEALNILMSPDPEADADDPHEGRRIERVRDGYLILNHEKYKRYEAQILESQKKRFQRSGTIGDIQGQTGTFRDKPGHSGTNRDMSPNVPPDQIRSQQIISDKNAIYKQDIEIESPTRQDNEVVNEHTLTSPRGNRVNALIARLWPDYSPYAAESAAKIVTDPRFSSLDLEQIIQDAFSTWPPSRGVFERNGVHGFIIAYLQNSVERQSRSARKSADENQRDRNREILQRVGEKK